MSTAVRRLADRVYDRQVELDVVARVQRGLPAERIRFRTPQTLADDASFAREILAELRTTEAESEDDRLTAGFLEHTLRGTVSTADNELLGFDVTPYMGGWMMSRTVTSAFAGGAGADAHLSLAADFRDSVRETHDRLRRQRDAGILVPKAAIAGCRAALEGAKDPALRTIPALAPAGADDAPLVAEIGTAFDALIGFLDDDYEAEAPDQLGLGQYPGGTDYYRALVREHTASDLPPEELHEIGLTQVTELADRMAEARAAMGFTGTENEFHEQLRSDSRLRAKEPADVDRLFLRHMARLQPLLSDYFAVLPEAPYGVRRLPPDKEAGMTYGYYAPPTPIEPTGYYYWNGARLETKSLLTYASLIFHELAPGHHFHLARQRENEDLPKVRREGHLGAFNEGWAEYASGLAWEMGLYDDPLDAYGKLVHERFTAQRLVVDTGLNLLGWSLHEAAAYMKANSTESDAQVATELVRYATDMPAQALSYRAGHLELVRIRRCAETAMGDRFDIKQFHEQILGPGALPFPVVDQHVQRWASGQLDQSP
jgi:uncharacterized protein (DUF885 family)